MVAPGDAATPSLATRALGFFRASGASEVLLPGLYAWGTTVAPPAVSRAGSPLARGLAFAALTALVVGPPLARRHPRIGRGVGVWAFVGLSIAVWALCPAALAPGKLDPVQAALGGLGWGFWALGWGAAERAVQPTDPSAIGEPARAPFTPRSRLPAGAAFILGLAIAASSVPLALAWSVTDPHRALFAHGAALAAAVALVTTGAGVAVGRGQPPPAQRPSVRLAAAARPLMILAALAVFGAAYALMR